MATNSPKDNARKGSVKKRSQLSNGNTHTKRNTENGQFMDRKNGKPYKGVAKEPDGRKKSKK